MAMSPFFDDERDEDPVLDTDGPLDEWRRVECDDEQERREISEHGPEDFG